MTLVVKRNNPINVAKVIAPFKEFWQTDFVDNSVLLVKAARSGMFYRIHNSNYSHWVLYEEMPEDWLEWYKQAKVRPKTSQKRFSLGYSQNTSVKYAGPYPELGGTQEYTLTYIIPFANLLSPRNFILGKALDLYYSPHLAPTYHFYANKDEYVEDLAHVLNLQTTTDLEDRSIYEFLLPTPIYPVPKSKLALNSKLILTVLDISDIRDIVTTFDIIGDMTFIDNEHKISPNKWVIKMILPAIVSRTIGMVQRRVIERNDLTILKRLSAMSDSIFADPFVMRWALANGISPERFVANDWEIGD